LRVAFAGTPEFALPALAALCARHTLVGVLTQPDRPKGRGRELTASAVKRAALARGLTVSQPESLKNGAGRALIEGWAPEVLVVVAYGLLLPADVLGVPRRGCLNIHASLLPRWRGAAPIQRALLAGDTETGVSIMQMDAGLDTGPVLLERRIAIARHHTSGSLHDELAPLGAAALIEALEGVEAGTLVPTPQPAEGATYAAKIEKTEAVIDWSANASDIERRVRAFNPWPVARTTLDGEPLRILGARALDAESQSASKREDQVDKIADPGSIIAIRDDSILVRCGRGILALTQLQRPGREAVPAGAFSHGQKLAGRRLG
jgi:methionyl-tRNA formyltransferase